MIDLSSKDLPNAIMVDGKSFLINTDFRAWLQVDNILKNKTWNLMDIAFVLKDDITVLDIIKNGEEIQQQLLTFYLNPNTTPRMNSNGNEDIVVDYMEDGEYIYASFMQAYGIDLLNYDMHWHKFLALFRGLPDNTIMVKIMGYRGYRKETKKNPHEEYKRIWALNKQKRTDEDMQKELEDLFYGAI